MIEVKETEDKEKVKNLNCRVGFIDKVVVFIEENFLMRFIKEILTLPKKVSSLVGTQRLR